MKNTTKIETFYQILGIDEKATKEEIKKAYHILAKKYHPDRFQSKEGKEEAEKKFKIIKKAYDELLEINNEDYKEDENINNSFSDFFNNDNYVDIENIYENENDFLKYYADNLLKEQGKTKVKNKSYDEIRNEMILDIENYIKENKISKLNVYKSIMDDLLILKISSDKKNDISNILMKETVYRKYIKNTQDYKNFILNNKFLKKINLDLILKIDNSLINKKFDKIIKYKIKNICSSCIGNGCNKCKNKGYIEEYKKTNIKIDNLSNEKKVYVIKSGGNVSPWITGKLNIEIKFRDNLYKKEKKKFVYDIKKTKTSIIDIANKNYINNLLKEIPKNIKTTSKKIVHGTKSFVDTLSDDMPFYLKTFKEFFLRNKIHFLYTSIIFILLIIIILLVVLL